MARIPLLEEADLAPEDRDLLARPINLNKALAHSPEGARAFSGLGSWIRWRCRLDPRLRELAILQVGCLAKSAYEYSHHIKIGKDFGLDDDDIRAVRAETRGEPGGLGPVETAVLKGAREMAHGPAMSEETFALLERELGAARVVDLVLVIAFYCGVVRLLETLEVDVEPDYQPWLDAFPLD